MAQPSQVFPPWLTPSLTVVTDAAGVPVSTETTIVYLPLTYFGPSIPLGSLWVFGGSTSPASVPTTSETTTILTTSLPPPLTTSAIPPTSSVVPPTSSVVPTSSATPTTTLSPSSNSSAIPTSASATSFSTVTPPLTTSFTSTFTPTTTSSVPTSSITPNSLTGGLSRGQLVGVIVASILGLIFLFVLALFVYLFCKNKRNRRQYDSPSPVDDEYYFVPAGGRTPGEGSPRHSGEEADPFLQRRDQPTAGPSTAGAAAMTQIPGEMGSRPTGSRVPVPTGGSQSSGSTNSNASGFGNVLERPTLGFMPSMPEEQMYPRGPLTVGQMAQLGYQGVQSEDQPPDAEYTGAYAYGNDPFNQPPRLVDPGSSYTGLKPSRSAEEGPKSNRSSYHGDVEESVTLLTATRVKMGRADPQIHDSSSSAGTSSLLNTLGSGLSSLANIGRKSWFKNLDSPRHSYHTPPYVAEPLSERDLETGRSMLSADSRSGAYVDSLGNRLRPEAVGTGPDGIRPMSNISARSGASGATIYHDAHSSVPGTPLLTPLPRAMTPAEQPVPVMPAEHAWISSPLAAVPSSPPAYEDQFIIGSPSPSSPARSPPSMSSPLGADVLDMPAPVALNHFASLSSIKDTPTGSSAGAGTLFKSPPFPPPGLETVRPIGWSEVVAIAEPVESHGGHGVGHLFHMNSGITIDVLEEEPPSAEEGWRSMASSNTSGAGLTGGDLARRGTFGMLPSSHPAFMSEQGSLHSMRSHFNPSMRSTGSAAASRRELNNGSLSSNSSRPSHHSSASAQSYTLSRTGSIPNENRRNLRANGTSGNVSPALSAFGGQYAPQMRASSSVADSAVAGLESPASAHVSPHKTGTLRSVGSSSMGSATVMDRSFGTLREEAMPWAGGLDEEWRPAA